jgi:glycosyltransferase involved in cell wall biosynthesis
MTLDLVSVIVPAFNRAELLPDAANSVLRQDHRDVELLIVDDGSTDDTAAVADEIAARDPGRVRVLRQSNAGPGAARRAGLAMARGEFVQYLDSDDLLEPGKFSAQVRALRDHPEAGVAYGLTMRFDTSTGVSKPWARTNADIEDIFPSFQKQRGWDTNSPLWRRSTCDAIGAGSDFRCLEDWEHDLRAGLLGIHPVRVDAHVATVRDHGGDRASGMSTGFTPALTRDFFRAHRAIWLRMRDMGRTDRTYLRSFCRKMFWVARMCGERGLFEEADQALVFAEEMSRTSGGRLGVRAFGLVARTAGWPAAVRTGEFLRRLAGRGAGSAR